MQLDPWHPMLVRERVIKAFRRELARDCNLSDPAVVIDLQLSRASSLLQLIALALGAGLQSENRRVVAQLDLYRFDPRVLRQRADTVLAAHA